MNECRLSKEEIEELARQFQNDDCMMLETEDGEEYFDLVLEVKTPSYQGYVRSLSDFKLDIDDELIREFSVIMMIKDESGNDVLPVAVIAMDIYDIPNDCPANKLHDRLHDDFCKIDDCGYTGHIMTLLQDYNKAEMTMDAKKSGNEDYLKHTISCLADFQSLVVHTAFEDVGSKLFENMNELLYKACGRTIYKGTFGLCHEDATDDKKSDEKALAHTRKHLLDNGFVLLSRDDISDELYVKNFYKEKRKK